VHRDDKAATKCEGRGSPYDASAPGQAGTAEAVAQNKPSHGGEDGGDDFRIPAGGLEIRRDPTPSAAGADVPEKGGSVIPQRPVGEAPADKSATADVLLVSPVTPASLSSSEQP